MSRRLLPALLVPAIALVPAWSDGRPPRSADAPVEDRGPGAALLQLRAGTDQWSIGEPTNEEQQLLELMNRARRDPAAEGDRILDDYDSQRVKQAVDYFLAQRPGVEYTRAENQAAFASYAAKPPFAFNGHLIAASRAHSELMKQYDVQSHQVQDTGGNFVEPSLRGRFEAQGYDGTNLAESVFSYAEDMLQAHAGFAVDWGQGVAVGQTRPALGHRLNLMGFDGDPGRNYVEVGIGVIDDTNSATEVGPKLVTIDFAIPFAAPRSFVTGVCYDDTNGNGTYDAGEGIGGVRIDLDVGTAFAISSASGGYAVPVTGSPGSVHVTATGASGAAAVIGTQTLTVNATGANVKADFTKATLPPPPPPPPETGVTFTGTLAFDHTAAVLAPINVAAQQDASVLLGDIQVEVAIDHPQRAEFKLTLVNPQGTEVVLFNHGPQGANLRGIFGGSLASEESLGSFIDANYVGAWKLRLEDTTPGNSGSLASWTLRMRPKFDRRLFAPETPLFVTKLATKDSASAGGDSLSLSAQVDIGAAALDPLAPVLLRLRTADSAHTELLLATVPAAAVKYAVKGTSRATIAAKFVGLDLPALPGDVEIELSIGGAIVRETVVLAKGAFNGAKSLPRSSLLHIGSITMKRVKGVPNYTIKGRLASPDALMSSGMLEVEFGDFRLADAAPAFVVRKTKHTYRGGAVKSLVVDTATGTFTLVIATTLDVRPGSTADLSLRLGDDGFFGTASVVPAETPTSLKY